MSERSLVFRFLGKDEVSKTFQKVGKESQTAGGHVSNFGSHLAGLAKGGVFALGALGAAGVVMGLKTASSMEQAQIAFTSLLGSGQKAKGFLGDLSKFAAATPFELPGLIDASRQLLGAGASAKSVIPTLTAFGDASGALGLSQDNFSHIMMATTQAMANGKLQAGDLLQITQAGLPVWKLLSEAMHKPVSKIRELSSQGKLMTADVLPKLQKQMEKDYGGSMAKQSQTVSGLWSTLMDTMNQGLAKVLIPLLPVLRDNIPKAAAAMSKAFDYISTTVLPKVISVVKAVVPRLMELGHWIQKNAEWLKPLVAVIGTMVGVGIIVSKVIKAWTAAQLLLDTVLAANPIGIVIVALAGLAAGLVYAYKHSETFRDIVQGAFHAVGAAASAMWDVIRPVLKFVVDMWLNTAGALVNGAAKAFGWVPGIGGKLKAAAKAFNKFRDDVNSALSGIHNRTINVGVQLQASALANSNLHKASGGQTIGSAKGFAVGGYVHGGIPGQDSVQAMLMPGEFVVRRDGSNLGQIATANSRRGGDTHITINTGPMTTDGARELYRSLTALYRESGGRMGVAPA